MAQGEYIAFLDSDDLWLPEKLARQITFFKDSPQAGMVFTQAWLIDERGAYYGDRILGASHTPNILNLENMYMDNFVTGPSTVLIKTGILRKIGGFDQRIRFGEDWDLWLQVAHFVPICDIKAPLACIRRHRGSQCYFPESSEKVSRVLRDHLCLLLRVPVSRGRGASSRGSHAEREERAQLNLMTLTHYSFSTITVVLFTPSCTSRSACLHRR
jgi:glycosyltransferase involved in cell wall biosynthesis